MHLASRPPYRRMTAIDRALKSDEFPSASRLAKELEVDRRTIFRDVEFMRCTFGAPIKVCRKRRGYYYAEPGFQLSAFQLTEGELLSLFVAERVMKQYRGTSFEGDLSRAFQKITSQLDDQVSMNVAEFEEAHSFRISAPSTQDVETFGRLAAAVRSRKRLRIIYWTASRDDVTQRKIDPLHLANIDGDWFLIAWCHLRNQVRSFVPSRIRELKATEESFAPPVDFSVAKYLSKGFRVIQDEPGVVHQVRLKFSPFAARYIAERTWHPSQKATRRDDGSLEIELEVASLIEVRKWALQASIAHPQTWAQALPRISRTTMIVRNRGRGSRSSQCSGAGPFGRQGELRRPAWAAVAGASLRNRHAGTRAVREEQGTGAERAPPAPVRRAPCDGGLRPRLGANALRLLARGVFIHSPTLSCPNIPSSR